MIATFKAPGWITRSKYDPDKKKFYDASMGFDISAVDDKGNKIEEFPKYVEFGPDLYKLLKHILPSAAARLNEDLHYKGVVPQKKINPHDLYAYYGYGDVGPSATVNGPLSASASPVAGYHFAESHRGPRLQLLGYGETPFPANKSAFGTDYAGNPNYKYSERLLKDSPMEHASKSAILTEILNSSKDFNPLFGPLYNYVDTMYDPKNDPQKHGPRPTDRWIPRFDKLGHPIMRADGTQVHMPVPLVQNLPFYNFNSPMWEDEDKAKALWDKFQKEFSPTDFTDWGETPIYANYDGTPMGHFDDRTNEFVYKALDYPLFNLKLANNAGYFEFAPELKAKAHEKFRDRKGYKIKLRTEKAQQEQVAKDEAAIKAAKIAHAKQAAKEQFFKTRDKNGEGGKTFSNNEQRAYYTSMIKGTFRMNPDLAMQAIQNGITKEDIPAMVRMVLDSPSKYNEIGSSNKEAQFLSIVNDYYNKKQAAVSQKNIIAGVKGNKYE